MTQQDIEQKAREEFEKLFNIEVSPWYQDEQGYYGYANPFHHCMWTGYVGGIESQRQQMVALEQQIAEKDAEIVRHKSRVKELEEQRDKVRMHITACSKANKHSCVFYD